MLLHPSIWHNTMVTPGFLLQDSSGEDVQTDCGVCVCAHVICSYECDIIKSHIQDFYCESVLKRTLNSDSLDGRSSGVLLGDYHNMRKVHVYVYMFVCVCVWVISYIVAPRNICICVWATRSPSISLSHFLVRTRSFSSASFTQYNQVCLYYAKQNNVVPAFPSGHVPSRSDVPLTSLYFSPSSFSPLSPPFSRSFFFFIPPSLLLQRCLGVVDEEVHDVAYMMAIASPKTNKASQKEIARVCAKELCISIDWPCVSIK